ncbi:MAG: malonic semialdehyde reductase [Alphaproteobacteria bacterium]
MSHILSDRDLDLIFRAARSHNVWTDKPVSDVTMTALYDLLRMGPTSANTSPARFLFLRSEAAKQRLAPHLSEGNRAKSMTAPLIAIIGYDLHFFEKLPELFPHNPDAQNWFTSNATLAETTAFRNGSLQGAYLIIAARALGLDCGPMSGFDNAGVDKEFFPDGRVKSNFICNLGYGDHGQLMPRNPRLAFDDACEVL